MRIKGKSRNIEIDIETLDLEIYSEHALRGETISYLREVKDLLSMKQEQGRSLKPQNSCDALIVHFDGDDEPTIFRTVFYAATNSVVTQIGTKFFRFYFTYEPLQKLLEASLENLDLRNRTCNFYPPREVFNGKIENLAIEEQTKSDFKWERIKQNVESNLPEDFRLDPARLTFTVREFADAYLGHYYNRSAAEQKIRRELRAIRGPAQRGSTAEISHGEAARLHARLTRKK
jgi:hypothetical protein